MSLGLRRVVQSLFAIQKCSVKSGVFTMDSEIGRIGHTGLAIPHRSIKQYEKEYKWALRGRKKKEEFMFPERYSKPDRRSSFTDWNYKAEIFACGKRLGEEFDEELLREALTDQSHIHQEKKKQEELGMEAELNLKNNEELSNLGHQITKSTLLEFLRKEIPGFLAEGHLALIHYLTSPETMADIAVNLGMKDLILSEEYPPSTETYARAMFAIVGAVEKSSNLERAQKFVVDFIASLLCTKDINELWDISRPWKMMEELAKKKGLYPVEARLIGEAGRNTIHSSFLVGIYDKDKQLLGKGPGETIDIAQEMAARDVLKTFFGTRDPRRPFEFQSKNIPYKLIPHVRNISG